MRYVELPKCLSIMIVYNSFFLFSLKKFTLFTTSIISSSFSVLFFRIYLFFIFSILFTFKYFYHNFESFINVWLVYSSLPWFDYTFILSLLWFVYSIIRPFCNSFNSLSVSFFIRFFFNTYFLWYAYSFILFIYSFFIYLFFYYLFIFLLCFHYMICLFFSYSVNSFFLFVLA